MLLMKYLEEPLNPRGLPDESSGDACKVVVGEGGHTFQEIAVKSETETEVPSYLTNGLFKVY